jgi:hypothetical protein
MYKWFFLSLVLANTLYAQVTPGTYSDGLTIAYNKDTKVVTGCFENYSGLDDDGDPKFSCIFYIEGKLTGNTATIKTYYPADADDDIIMGTLQVNGNSLVIKLPEEHGGCWNVQHFADEPVTFKLETKSNWIAVRYANKDKVYFYKMPLDTAKHQPFVLRGDVVYVEKFKGEWAYCSYRSKKVTTGWVKVSE